MRSSRTSTRRGVLSRGPNRVGTGTLVALALANLALSGCGGESEDGGGAASESGGTVGFMGFEGDDFPDAMASWAESSGTTVVPTYINSPFDAVAKLQSGGNQQVDVIDFPSSAIDLFRSNDLLAPIDESLIPNLENLFPYLSSGIDEVMRNDDGDLIAVPFYVSPFGVSYNESAYPEPPNPEDLLDPSAQGSYALIDYPNGVLGMACVQLGCDPSQLTTEELEEVSALLRQYVANARTVAPSVGQAATLLSSGEVNAVYPDGGFAVGIIPEAERANFATNLDPEGGNIVTLEMLGVYRDAANPEGAAAFINQMISAEVNAAGASALGQGVVNSDAVSSVSEANSGLYPYDDFNSYLEGLTLATSPPAESDEYVTSQQWIDEWTNIKAG